MSDNDMTPLDQEVFDTFILGFGMTMREADAIQKLVQSESRQAYDDGWDAGYDSAKEEVYE